MTFFELITFADEFSYLFVTRCPLRTAARKSAELFWAELYVPRSSFHWAVNQFQRSELLVLFLFCCALRQWRRGNIALMTTLPALGCLNLVQRLQPRCLEDRFLLNKTRKTKHHESKAASGNSLVTLERRTSLGRRDSSKDDSSALSSSRKLSTNIPSSSWATASKKMLQTLCSSSSSEGIMSSSPSEERRKGRPPRPKTCLPSCQKHVAPDAYGFTIRSLLMMPSRIFALYVPVRLPGSCRAPQSCLDLLHTAQIIEIYSFVFCFSQRPKCLGLLVFSRFLTFDLFVQFYILVVHGLPFSSLDPLENGLADDVPVLIDERWLPTFVSLTRGVDQGAQCTFCSQCQLIRSFHKPPIKPVVNDGFTTGLACSCPNHQLPPLHGCLP